MFFFNNSVKITEKLWNRVLECWPALTLSNEKRISVLSVLQKKLLKKQRANFFWTTRYILHFWNFYAQYRAQMVNLPRLTAMHTSKCSEMLLLCISFASKHSKHPEKKETGFRRWKTWKNRVKKEKCSFRAKEGPDPVKI